LPASAGFDIAVGAAKYGGNINNTLACPNVEAWNIDGVTVPITAFLADRYNNPVPDGTAVAFYANGGHVDGSCVTGPPSGASGEGTCTVTWTSANPRPRTTDDPSQPQNNVLVNGRAQVLATAVGEESFTDNNASGFYQAGDPFANLGEPFLSTNESGVYATGNYFLDYFQKGVYQGPSGSFIGITCTGTTPSSTCSTSTLAIGASHLVIMSTSNADMQLAAYTQGGQGFTGNSGTVYAPQLTMKQSVAAVPPAGTPPTGGSPAVTYSGTISVELQDENCTVDPNNSPHCYAGTGNPLPAGTTVTAVLDNTSIGTVSVTPVVIGCATDIGGVLFQFAFTASTTGGSGTITVTATTPNGTINPFRIGITVQ
jgi:hypothetical protein